MKYDDENPTRDPRPAPFPVGTRLRCVDRKGARLRFGRDGVKYPERDTENNYVTVYGYGLEVTIDETRPGHQGTGRTVYLDKKLFISSDDGDEGFIDSTSDGYSVYHVEGTKHGRCISPEDARKWKVIGSTENR